jgi:hypothetical protein
VPIRPGACGNGNFLFDIEFNLCYNCPIGVKSLRTNRQACLTAGRENKNGQFKKHG